MPQTSMGQMLGSRPNGGVPRQLFAGYVSTEQPAPASTSDPVYVVVPNHSSEQSVAMWWPPIFGSTLPQQGTPCMVGYDDNGTPWVLMWIGEYSA